MKTLGHALATAALSASLLVMVTPAQARLAASLVEQAAMDAQAVSVRVEVTRATTSTGDVWIGLYPDEASFGAGAEMTSITLEASTAGVAHTFEGLTPGEYAVITFHDENRDGDFNRNFMGMPEERYGFSNNPRPRFRAANWNEARFEVREDRDIQIELFGAN